MPSYRENKNYVHVCFLFCRFYICSQLFFRTCAQFFLSLLLDHPPLKLPRPGAREPSTSTISYIFLNRFPYFPFFLVGLLVGFLNKFHRFYYHSTSLKIDLALSNERNPPEKSEGRRKKTRTEHYSSCPQLPSTPIGTNSPASEV